jgi:hypothetical protein
MPRQRLTGRNATHAMRRFLVQFTLKHVESFGTRVRMHGRRPTRRAVPFIYTEEILTGLDLCERPHFGDLGPAA